MPLFPLRSKLAPAPATALVLTFLLAFAGCAPKEEEPTMPFTTVARRDIKISARAAGVVQPVTTIEVKSQASGAITEVNVNEGDHVVRGQLLARVDQRIPENAVRQAEADSVVARAGLQNAESQLRRSEQLFRERALTQDEIEAARFARASAAAELVRAQRALEDARIAYVQTEVRAPSDGVILSRAVEVGSVIASASRDVGGGAVLLRMAALDNVEVRALADETDIGRIKPGLAVTITVAAYPDRTFEGEVLRVGAEAMIEQNVTTFPVLVRIQNRNGLLKPGMNAEMEIHIDRAMNAVTVANAALRDPEDVSSAAQLVGMHQDTLRRQLQSVGENELAVFAMRDGRVQLLPVSTGLTDFDYSVVRDGLALGDSVMILPSAGLLADQERRDEWIQRRVGGGPLGNN